ALRQRPDYALAYYNRGNAKDSLGDKRGAIADYDQAIRLQPDYANAYYNRGLTKADIGDRRGAIADLRVAARFYQQQGNTEWYNRAMDAINKLSR
ncbi:MAG: tetratricopeptide repeat protein, partial [Cyanobacteria bacterium]|nr:tetratricopeptide repeat protein [Cyanobacteriota bacterium]